MLRHGSAMWHLWAFGAATIPPGFALWHGQGAPFGLGTSPRPVYRRITMGMLLLFALVISIELA